MLPVDELAPSDPSPCLDFSSFNDMSRISAVDPSCLSAYHLQNEILVLQLRDGMHSLLYQLLIRTRDVRSIPVHDSFDRHASLQLNSASFRSQEPIISLNLSARKGARRENDTHLDRFHVLC